MQNLESRIPETGRRDDVKGKRNDGKKSNWQHVISVAATYHKIKHWLINQNCQDFVCQLPTQFLYFFIILFPPFTSLHLPNIHRPSSLFFPIQIHFLGSPVYPILCYLAKLKLFWQINVFTFSDTLLEVIKQQLLCLMYQTVPWIWSFNQVHKISSLLLNVVILCRTQPFCRMIQCFIPQL